MFLAVVERQAPAIQTRLRPRKEIRTSPLCSRNLRDRTRNVITNHRTGGAMQIDALFALVFRTYNAAEFNSIAKANLERADIDGQMRSIPVTHVSSQSESLYFDEKSGRLLRAEFRTSRGNIIADFDDYAEVGAKKQRFPTSIRVQVPAFLYEGSQVRLPNTGGDALLQIDPAKVQIKERGQ